MLKKHLTIDEIADVAVAKFLVKRIMDERIIQAIADQLFDVVASGKHRLLLNFNGVEYLSSIAISKLIHLHKKLEEMDGTLAICNAVPQIQAVLAVTNLDETFEIYPTAEAALASLKSRV